MKTNKKSKKPTQLDKISRPREIDKHKSISSQDLFESGQSKIKILLANWVGTLLQ